MADVTRYCVHYMSESGKPWIAGDVIAMVRNEDRIIVGHSSGGARQHCQRGNQLLPGRQATSATAAWRPDPSSAPHRYL